ncbi:MAG: LuxR C-terminal-related transcriptional regulator [Armatimonadota bacterium]
MIQFTQNEADTISHICQDAYSGISSPDMWNQFLISIRSVIDADGLGVILYDRKSGRPVDKVLIDIDPETYQKYEEQYYDKDPFSRIALESKKHVFTPSDILGEENWKKTVFYSDFLLPAGDPEVLILECGTPSNIMLLLSLSRRDSHEHFNDKDRECMKILHPHFTNAYKRQLLLDDIARSNKSFLSIMDQVNRPIIIFDADFTPLHLNCSFLKLVSDNRCLHDIQKSLEISARNIIISSALNGDHLSSAGDDVITIDDTKYRMVISRIEPSDAPVYYIADLEEIANHLCRIIDASAHKYRLSDREIEICIMIMKGLSNREIAETLYLSEYTVKDHLKNILEKLHVNSRSKALAKLFGSL